ncbi:MAG: tRNA (adenosine(37)-N6)-threonylcarbamoyltransferase complex dimerization subunit type 1 TsaB [Muribaculaceae bacterium]|nr:tRNA (adenosine(37)-N6)-threonylcarbamoyltransferase complex dimerization subunit type 1 TsaB [Muribaculaceae bacterium]
MSTILHIETSTDVCSVAVSEDSQVIFQQDDHSGPNHAERLGTMVDEALSFTDNHAIPFDAVAVSCGPGSYTGLRIGVSTAKGVCFGRDARLISVPTLEVLCVPVLLQEKVKEDNALLCPMLDARRMEVYAALFDRSLREVRPTQADIVDGDTYRAFLDERPVYFFGNGAAKCMEVINHPNARFIEGVVPLARWMFPLAERRFFDQKFEDVAYFEPFYLKDFVAKAARDLLNIEH